MKDELTEPGRGEAAPEGGREPLYEDGGAPVYIRDDGRRWRAGDGEEFWILDEMWRPDISIEMGGGYDDAQYDSGNYFRTREEAQDAARKIKKLVTGK